MKFKMDNKNMTTGNHECDTANQHHNLLQYAIAKFAVLTSES